MDTAITQQAITSEPLPYHRLARYWAPGRRLRPLWGVLLGAALYFGFGLVAIVGAVTLEQLGFPQLSAAIGSEAIDATNPLTYAAPFTMIALLLPAILLGFWVVGCRPIGLLSSVAGHLRWGWLGRLAAGAVAIWAVTIAVSLLVDALTRRTPAEPTGSWWLVIVVLLFTPFQAAAEEYVFRGAFGQLIGAWLKHPAWAILLPIPLFTIGHQYNWIGLVDVSLFALAAGWLTWRTGGLEAAVVMHVVNNTLLGLLIVPGLSNPNLIEASYTDLLFGLLPVAAFTAWVEWNWRRQHGLTRLRTASDDSQLVGTLG